MKKVKNNRANYSSRSSISEASYKGKKQKTTSERKFVMDKNGYFIFSN